MGKDNGCYMGEWDLKHYYRCLGEKGRDVFLKWLTDEPLPSDKRNEAINYEYSNDYRDDVYRAGDKIVYLYTNDAGIPFYVGKGSETRALDINSRNSAFVEKFNQNGVCRIFAIVSNISDCDSLDVETFVINELLDRGWRLTNSHKISIDTEKHRRLSEDYPEVLVSINNITRSAMNTLLDDIDYFGEIGKVVRKNKTSVRAIGNQPSNVV